MLISATASRSDAAFLDSIRYTNECPLGLAQACNPFSITQC